MGSKSVDAVNPVAQRISHTVKGVAGNIAATELLTDATALDVELKKVLQGEYANSKEAVIESRQALISLVEGEKKEPAGDRRAKWRIHKSNRSQ